MYNDCFLSILQKNIIGLLVIAFLSGCAAFHQAHNGRTQKETSEESGWARLEELSAAKCGADRLPPARDRAVEMSKCITRLVEEHVLPQAAFPEILLASRKEALRLAKHYAGGGMSSAEYRRRSENRLRNYQNSLIYLTHKRTSPVVG